MTDHLDDASSECEAMQSIAATLAELTPKERENVLAWIEMRFMKKKQTTQIKFPLVPYTEPFTPNDRDHQ